MSPTSPTPPSHSSHCFAMSPNSFSPAILICVLLVLSLSGMTMSFPPACVLTLDCGPLKNLSYPFTSQPNCSPPEFRLTCDDDSAQLTIASVTYRVLQVDQAAKTMTLARSDLWETACLQKFTNSTMNSSLVEYDSDNEDLAIFYGCFSGFEDKAHNLFSCNFYGIADQSYAFYLTGPVPTDPILSLINCSVGVSAKILKTAASELAANRSTLQEVLKGGFHVKYIDLFAETCLKCPAQGGECGFDPKSGQPACLCGNRTCDPTGNSGVTLGVGIGIGGGGIVGVFLGGWIFSIMRGRKKRARESQSKGPLAPPLGKGIPISLANFSQRDIEHDQLNIEEIMKNFGSIGPKRYTYSDVKKLTNSFKEKVGQGGYGIVYKGKLCDGRVVAVKILNESKGNGEDFINEVASISRTSHVNIVTLVGFCYEKTKRALIYEFMQNGSLDKLIYDKGSSTPNSHLDSKTMFQIAIGVARGLEYLHRGCNTRILHFDIKPHNILLDEDLCPKISDFGLAKLCKPKESIVSMTGMRGTVGYIAPEVFNRYFGRVSHKSDVYSYGMLVLEMNGARKMTDTRDSHGSEVYFPHGIYNKLEQGESFGIFEDVAEEEEDIIKKMIMVSLWCIQINPLDRPSMGKVIEMLEGPSQSLQVPSKPSFDSPIRPPQDSSMTSLSQNLTFQMPLPKL